MTATEWLGMNNPAGLNSRALEQAHAIADAARDYQWPLLLELLGKDAQRINAGRIGGASGYAPLHQVAHGGAPIEVAQALISLGHCVPYAPRTASKPWTSPASRGTRTCWRS